MGADKNESFCVMGVFDDQDHTQINRRGSEGDEEDLEMIMEEEDSSSFSSFSSDGSVEDNDASSSLSSSQSNEALYDLSELMKNLPIKRGLSKFYQGKSQSFTSLARVTSVEDLAKKPNSFGGYSSRMKSYKLNSSIHQQRSTSPKSTISKKSSSSSSLACLRRKTNNRTCFIDTKSSISCVERKVV